MLSYLCYWKTRQKCSVSKQHWPDIPKPSLICVQNKSFLVRSLWWKLVQSIWFCHICKVLFNFFKLLGWSMLVNTKWFKVCVEHSNVWISKLKKTNTMSYNCIIPNLMYVLFPVNEVTVCTKAGLHVLQDAEKKSLYGPFGFFKFSSPNCSLQIA